MEERVCEKCGGDGWIGYTGTDGLWYARPCDCMKRKRSMDNIERSGLINPKIFTLDRFITDEPWQQRLMESAEKYLADPAPSWFFVGGQPGSGKTHLCTGICLEMINTGYRIRYEVWPRLKQRMKRARNFENEYERQMGDLREVQVLYLDDLFKGRYTEADRQLAWEIINTRYAADRVTIISSEHHLSEIVEMDEAVGGRIYQMSAGYRNNVQFDEGRDFRRRA